MLKSVTCCSGLRITNKRLMKLTCVWDHCLNRGLEKQQEISKILEKTSVQLQHTKDFVWNIYGGISRCIHVVFQIKLWSWCELSYLFLFRTWDALLWLILVLFCFLCNEKGSRSWFFAHLPGFVTQSTRGHQDGTKVLPDIPSFVLFFSSNGFLS